MGIFKSICKYKDFFFPTPKKMNNYFYELRISVDNEIRVILFAVDNANINLSTKVIFLNGFIKKSTKDYDKEMIKANHILRNLL